MQKFRRLLVYAPFILSIITVMLLIGFFLEQKESPLKVIFLDVGQGDAIFIQTPSKKQILIDSGPGPQILSELGQVMLPWDRTIDMVIATHPDKDHIGGFPDVFDQYAISSVIDNGFNADKEIADDYESGVNDEHTQHITINHPDAITLDDGVKLSFLRSIHDDIINENDGSIALRLDYGVSSFLFTGDAGVAVEFDLVKNQYDQLDVDVLKLGHHGSKTSSSELFLNATTPNMTVISAGLNNSYGHPHKEVMERLDFLKIPSMCTCSEGRITFMSDGEVLEMRK